IIFRSSGAEMTLRGFWFYKHCVPPGRANRIDLILRDLKFLIEIADIKCGFWRLRRLSENKVILTLPPFSASPHATRALGRHLDPESPAAGVIPPAHSLS